jgi:hypothetical protein
LKGKFLLYPLPLLFDFRWKEESPLFYGVENTTLQEYALTKEQSFSLKIKDTPLRCVGSLHQGKYDPCPNNEVGTKKCEICKRAEEYFPCQFCNGFNCDRFRNQPIENCEATHMVYLALFTPSLIKIGVSRLSRGRLRQIEQGSHFTRILAEGLSGISARRMESTLCKYNFPDKIPISQKKDFLFPEISEEQGRKLLAQKAVEAQEIIRSEMPELHKFILLEEKFWNNTEYYAKNFDWISKSPKAVHFIALKPKESISGKIVVIKGSYFAIETEDEFVILCAKDLIGHTVSFDPLPNGLCTQEAFQSALF